MRLSLICLLSILITGCASSPAVTTVLPDGSDFAHVVSTRSERFGSGRATPDAYVSEIHLQSGRSALPGSWRAESMPLDVLTEFFIRPGHYKLRYGCAGWKMEMPLYASAYFAPNKQYKLSCTPGAPRLIIEAAPNNSFKPKPLRGSA